MVACREIGLYRLAPCADFGIVVFTVPGRDIIRHQVRQAQLDVAQLTLYLLQCLLTGLEPVPEVFHGREQRLDILALGFRLADTLGARIALALQLLGFDLQRLAALLECQVGVGIKLEAAARQVCGHVSRRLTE